MRPLVYVYDLPSIYNTRLLQYRVVKVGICASQQVDNAHTHCKHGPAAGHLHPWASILQAKQLGLIMFAGCAGRVLLAHLS